jgi:hypothetical protein
MAEDVRPAAAPGRLPADLDRELVSVYRGWDRLERENHRASVLDFDLAPPGPGRAFASRDEVLDALGNLARDVERANVPGLALIEARLRASRAYLRALAGDSPPLASYVRDTMGVEPQAVPDERLDAARDRVREALAGFREIPFTRRGFNRFVAAFRIDSGKNLRGQFEFFSAKWLPVLAERIGASIDPASVAVEFAEEDAYWKNWISGNVAEGAPITLRINVHRRHLWYQGAVEGLVLHEYCGHAVQMALWRDAVRRGEMSGFYGVLTVHCPDQFLLEGLAESVAHVLPDERCPLERKTRIIRELHRYNLLVLNNVHLLANDGQGERARRYAEERMPFTPLDTIARELRDRTTHPLYRTYQYVYGPAKEAFVEALGAMPAADRWAALRRLYRTPMTPAQVLGVLAGA